VAQPFGAAISGLASPVGSLPIDGQPPRQAHQPRAEPIAVAQLTEVPIRLDERFLSHVFGVLPVAQHAVRHTKGESGGFNQARFEFPVEPFVHVHEAAGEAVRSAMHPVSVCQTPPARGWFSAGKIILNMSAKLSRREALELLAAAVGASLAESRLHAQAAQPTFERGAVIRTLLRDVAPDAISGPTLFHEHLSIRYPLTRAMAQAQGRDVPASFTDDVDLMIEETKAAARDGVACIVDGGHPDMDRDLEALQRIATASALPIVASGGFYMQRNYPPEVASKSADQIADELVRDAAPQRRVWRNRSAGAVS
jgi:hypothetical protein